MVDDTEILKAIASESVKQFLAPVQFVFEKLCGPGMTEAGLMIGDRFRVMRLKQSVRLLADIQQASSAAGLALKPVAPKLLFPILDAACLEDEESLHWKWVALLTNASTTEGEVLPCFADILKQLTSEEAQFLDSAYDESVADKTERETQIRAANPVMSERASLAAMMGISPKLLATVHAVLIGNLERLNLVTRNNVPLHRDDTIQHVMPTANHLYVSDLGGAFVRGCRLPAARS